MPLLAVTFPTRREVDVRRYLAVFLVGILIGGLLFLAGPSPAGPVDRIKKLEKQVVTLKKKTQWLNKQGFYRSFIGGHQVLSLCDPGTPAVWANEIDNLTELDVCETLDQQMLREALRGR